MTLKTVSLKCIIIFQYFSLLFLFLQEKYINNDAVFKKKKENKNYVSTVSKHIIGRY